MALHNASLPSLWVASYASPIYHLALVKSGSNYSLNTIWQTADCGWNPGWLELDKSTNTLYCLNEAYTLPNSGSLSSWSIDSTSQSYSEPSLLNNVTTDYGPVHGTIIAPNRLGLAHYAGGGASVWDTTNESSLIRLQTFHYHISEPGPSPVLNFTLQSQSYPHGIFLDPTGKYVVLMDRGADAIRSFRIGWDNRLLELDPHSVAPGNGPRHCAFVKGQEKTFIYVLGELTNSLHGFEVLYHPNETIGFQQFYNDSTYQTGFGDGGPQDPRGLVIPAEIASPSPTRSFSVQGPILAVYMMASRQTLLFLTLWI
ncbi:hypothetical protein NA57DRAFT_60446 [Rhizodiscina lignyota]|uniref:Isomerase YbhE n=1 Tax=Rhizodiscina lignyota TaxID=1504668 RepID=A0A9P4I763_9PEZI|nr:hypothetical protein NA57DRAFT_60446 [Rhizodiscina lignyota]